MSKRKTVFASEQVAELLVENFEEAAQSFRKNGKTWDEALAKAGKPAVALTQRQGGPDSWRNLSNALSSYLRRTQIVPVGYDDQAQYPEERDVRPLPDSVSDTIRFAIIHSSASFPISLGYTVAMKASLGGVRLKPNR